MSNEEVEWISRAQAMKDYGIPRGRLDYLRRIGVLEYKPGTSNMLSIEQVKRIAATPAYGDARALNADGSRSTKPQKRQYIYREQLLLAYRALAACAQWAARNEDVRKKIGTTEELLNAATAFELKYKEVIRNYAKAQGRTP